MRTVKRFELKYLLTHSQYLKLRNALAPYMKQDKYTATTGRYIVRSLYFDTFDYIAYQEKLNGDPRRFKLRLRSYARDFSEAEKISVEIKARRGDIVEKYSTFISPEKYQSFMVTKHWFDSNPVLQEFERQLFLKSQRPRILVDYEREGYYCRDGNQLRVTFDHYAKSTLSNSLFLDDMNLFRLHNRSTIVLEIKCSTKKPEWLVNLVKKHQLKRWSNSKYAQAVQLNAPEIMIPRSGIFSFKDQRSLLLPSRREIPYA